jgi:hypothetical protein
MYERRIENSMYKTIKQLKKLKNEPISSSTTERQEQRYELPEASEVDYEKLPITLPPEVEKIISRIRKNLNLDEIKDSTIENPVSSSEKTKNEPNYTPSFEAKRRSASGGQNEPNSTNAGNKLKAPPKAAQLNNQSSIIDIEDPPRRNQCKGEHNFSPDAPKNPINHSRPKVESTNNQSSIINNQCKAEPNLHDQMKVTQDISKDYELTRPGELLQKIINQSRPQAESTNNKSSIINN